MKLRTPLIIIFLIFCQRTSAQTCSASMTASGPTTFCAGGSVLLTADSQALKKANFSGGSRGLAASFFIGTKAYVGTGYHSNYKNDFWEYDPSNNTWTQKATYGGVPRSHATGFSIDGKGYMGTGNNGSVLKDFWEYDPTINTWTRKADFGGTARINACSFSIGNKGYLGTGLDANNNYTKDFWEYNPASNAWTRKADFGGVGRYAAASFVIGTKGYLGTGVSFTTVNTKDFWEYNPASNTWIRKADFGGMERFGAVGFTLGSSGFIGTGYSTTFMKDLWKYNSSANAWSRCPDFSGTPREFSIALSIGSKAYIGIGIDNQGYCTDFWEYETAKTYLWSTGETTPEILVKTRGSYTLTVTDIILGCSATSPPIKVNVKQPGFSDTTATVCNTFTWHGITYKTSGDYSYIVSDKAGCDSTTTLHLTIKSIHSTYTRTNASCYGTATGSIIITPNDGLYPYTYRIGTTRPFVTDSSFTGLKAGNYRITIKDATGCAGISDTITLTQLPIITYSYGATDALCYASPTGSFYINATSGIAPFQYKLGSAGTFNSYNSFANLRGGNYRVTIKDAQGCLKTSGTIIVGQPPQVRASFIKTDEGCPDKSDGTITMTDSIGVKPFVYKYGTVGTYSTTSMFTGLKAGNYRIFVKDANNCIGLSVVIPIFKVCGTTPEFEPLTTENRLVVTKHLHVYPNPSNGKITLQVNNGKAGKAEIIVCNESGVTILQKQVNLQASQNNINIDLQNFAVGIYFVKVRSDQSIEIAKVVITR